MRGTLPTSWALAFAVALTSWWSPVDGVASGDAPGYGKPRIGVRVKIIEKNRIAIDGAVVVGRHITFG